MRISYVFSLFIVNWTLAFSGECSTPLKTKRLDIRYQPRRDLFCTDCQPQHKHLLLVDVAATDRLRECSVIKRVGRISRLKSTLDRFESRDIVLVLSAMHLAYPVMTVMAEELRNVSMFTYNNSKSLTKACRLLRDSCYHLDNLSPVIAQIRGSTTGEKERNLSSYDTYWIFGAEKQKNSSTVHKQLEKLEAELCKRERRHNHLIEVNEDFFFEEKSPEMRLSLKDLLPLDPNNYDKNRAPKMSGKATVVHFHVTVLSLDSINEEAMTYVADIFLAQSWRDPRLRLPGNMKGEYRILDVEWLKDIWRPDCFFKNAKKVTFHEISVPNHYLWLYHDKTLLYMSKLTLVLSCAMKFESYPHDTQICLMMIESLSHTVQDLVFIWNATDPLVVNADIELPQLDISRNYTGDCTIEYSTGNFTCLAVVFNLKRRLGYHLLHTYIPSALIVVMSWISFWIKPEAIPARVTLGVTSLLTLATQNTQSQQSLPPVSYVKAIDVWMSSCSVFVFLSLMEFAIAPTVALGLLIALSYFYNLHSHEGFSRFWLGFKHGNIQDYQCTISVPDELNKFFRPPVECSMCRGVTRVEKVANLTPDAFEDRYAYSGRPVVIVDGMANWTAKDVFSFDYLKSIYETRMEQWSSYGCQFFPYNTEFSHLKEVFNMSKERAVMLEGTKPWYVGWSNCDDDVNVILRRHYERPYFLPTTAESKTLDWIFMGSTGYGAPMHIDNVEHPSWQAQLRGSKKWSLQPPPECYYTCSDVQVTVHPGEIIVLDTNRWYHSTLIVSEEMSITIGAEYD